MSNKNVNSVCTGICVVFAILAIGFMVVIGVVGAERNDKAIKTAAIHACQKSNNVQSCIQSVFSGG